MKSGPVIVMLTDVEPAVRLNAALEQADVDSSLVSPLDDVRGAIEKVKPQVIVFTGGLFDTHNVSLARQLLWKGVSVLGLADVHDDLISRKLRDAGYAEVYAKPIDVEEVTAGIKRLLERREVQRLTGLTGESSAMLEVLVRVEQMAPVSSTVLIEGESGTGKELVARALHTLSPRRSRPFIGVNVGALADTLLESELFGHEKGAFTGAAERRLGRFELANKGTLFLDEIGDIPHPTQVKLLRVLEEREMMRVGGVQNIPVDVRVVAATNRPIRDLVASGEFRADLYYRLNVLRIYLPPLRERRDDIPVLVRRFVREMSALHERPFKGISSDAMRILVEYSWPGNIRELRNLVESMVVLAPGREISAEDIPRQIREGGEGRFLPVHVGRSVQSPSGGGTGPELEFILRSLLELKLQTEELRRRVEEDRAERNNWLGEMPTSFQKGGGGMLVPGIEVDEAETSANVVTVTPGMRMAEVEQLVIEAALRETRGNRRKAAEMLGIGERTLYRKLKEYKIPEHGVA